MAKPHVNILSRDRLHEMLDYDPETGVFRWRLSWSMANVKVGDIAGHMARDGYRMIRADKLLYKASRLAWLYVHGEPIPALVDHINGDKDDNRIINLRAATKSQNAANSKVRVDNISGFRGVHFYTRVGKWISKIRINGEDHFLGYFSTKEAAVAAYEEKYRAAFGEFARK